MRLRGAKNWIGGGAKRVPIIQTEQGFSRLGEFFYVYEYSVIIFVS